MIARNEFKRPFELRFDARPVLAAAQLRLAAWVDVRVARWLERRAVSAEAAQGWFEADRKSARERGGMDLVVSSPRWN
jgi:hypothetical protein